MTGKTRYRVLIAEDDYLVCEEIKRSITSMGYEHVGSATNGLLAVEMVKSIKPDIVLMDIQMPEMDGLSAAKKIQETQSTPVIILTAHDSIEYIQKASEFGVGAFLTKPPKSEEIERAVIVAIDRHKDFTELKRLNNQLEKELLTRKHAEDQLTRLLKEKELLLKEIHHRVKNNFMIISSLINLQSSQIHDTQVKDMLKETHNRINSMSLIHEKLYQSNDLYQINFKGYINNLVDTLSQSYSLESENISVETHINNINLDINHAIPIGLIVNELVTNALRHAFPEPFDKTRKIIIRMSQHNNQLELTIQDNGIGLPEGFNIATSKSLGMRLIYLLVSNQLQGKFNIKNEKGTIITITIPHKKD